MTKKLIYVAGQDPETDELIAVIEEINSRGSNLIEAFGDIDLEDMAKLLPDLIAFRDNQDKIVAALDEMREQEGKG